MVKQASEGKDLKKFAYFLPNTFTALNMGCGFFSIIFVQKGLFHQACMLLLLGSIFDSVDGRVARITGTESAFGEQFDSLSDVISFGIAPAFIIYNRFLFDHGRFGMVICFLFCLAGSLRLARFNANIDRVDPSYFQGLPIPAAAMALIGYCLLSLEFSFPFPQSYFTIPFVLIYAFLMISNIPFYSFKKSTWIKNHPKWMLLILILVFCLIFIYEQIMIFSVIITYTLLCLGNYGINLKKFSR